MYKYMFIYRLETENKYYHLQQKEFQMTSIGKMWETRVYDNMLGFLSSHVRKQE